MIVTEGSFITGSFYRDGKPLPDSPEWGMSTRMAGNMRFRWNESNPLREEFLTQIAGNGHNIVPVELIHSKNVCVVSKAYDTDLCQADGIITVNSNLVPVVTVADCMPIFIYDCKKGVFGVLHSGWKGTGIVESAIKIAHDKFGSNPQDFCVVMGPHIHKCCYFVDRDRAEYFKKTFTESCVTEKDDGTFALSLADANLCILDRLGVQRSNIYISGDCTCCNDRFGSFRREAVKGAGSFTVQAAWVKCTFSIA